MSTYLTGEEAVIVKNAALTLRALQHKLRQNILSILQKKGKATVTELYIQLRLEQSVCSQHLSILRNAGLVITERSGKCIYYSENKDAIQRVLTAAGQLK